MLIAHEPVHVVGGTEAVPAMAQFAVQSAVIDSRLHKIFHGKAMGTWNIFSSITL